MQGAITVLLWGAAISAGLMAGIYFAFSTFLMQSLAALAGDSGMAAMQSINRIILRSPFLPLFFASSAVCAVLAVAGLVDLKAAGGWQMTAGAGIYLLGMLLVTIVGNVPLNNALDAATPGTAQGAAMWTQYLDRWTVWNHVRTLACTLSMAMLVWAIALRWNLT
ncbi:DUF1772 domain-containing protein [Alteraurantiacibacter aestuarii]|uniref:DUF1772 domain-containing protein n=1 Tax=Alteraurantiacibacter aestuarii TaxID=650004 RepID=A0A844ZKJ2_9SPHN|nr:anthrone oxygenase family protein [Alteraurantiacibacter aestuarii]MXO87540.1 DUF1772 domain-containing protein [Alteraurantiacibacter aestuarii]